MKTFIEFLESVEKTTHLNDLPGQIHSSGEMSKEHIKHHNEISKTLHNAQNKPNTKEKNNLKYWSGDSAYEGTNSNAVNKKLAINHAEGKSPTEGMKPWDVEAHNSIKKLTNHPLGHEVHLYTGIGTNRISAVKKSKEGILHIPSHMSTSHDVSVAANFANMYHEDSGKGRHIMHVHAKASDKGFHMGKYSEVKSEHETILPAGTKLKYSHSTNHVDDKNNKYTVHHFTIHSQE